MPSRLVPLLAAGTLCLGVLVVTAEPAQAEVQHYKNCAAVHKDYSGGIAKPGVTTNLLTRSGKKVRVPLNGEVKHSTALYKRNRSLDRDGDGVACET
ncbi:excalibur calcium-binding domain-containing protein [uncultured Amnibacterium sp.]|uniref:excalibur calcium-binding domain-containing protein n=1 Tax=uncultured Amnibacterium sp. TaxID=1631851 RepID=UPI0035C9CA0A